MLREQIARAIYATLPVGERGWEDAPKYTRDRCLICADAALATIEASGTHVVVPVANRRRWQHGR